MTPAPTLTVRDVMTADIRTVKAMDTVSAAIELMTSHDIGSVIVIEDAKPVGILTERDILKRVCPKHLCPKGIASIQLAGHPDRLTHPVKSRGL